MNDKGYYGILINDKTIKLLRNSMQIGTLLLIAYVNIKLLQINVSAILSHKS